MNQAGRRARALVDRLETEAEMVGVEVGVYRGEASAHLLRLCPHLTLHMVDSWLGAGDQPASYRATGDPKARADLNAQLRAKRQAEDAVRFAGERAVIHHMASLAAAASFLEASLDFVFVDADHSYEAVSADIAAWLPKIRPGGLLSGHDYSKPGERSAVGWPGVVRAVDAAVSEHGWIMERGNEATWFVRLP